MAEKEKDSSKGDVKPKRERDSDKKDRANKRAGGQSKDDKEKEIVKVYKEHKERKQDLERKIAQSTDDTERAKLLVKWREAKNEESELVTEAKTVIPEIDQILAPLIPRLRDFKNVNFDDEQKNAESLMAKGGVANEVAGMIYEDEIANTEKYAAKNVVRQANAPPVETNVSSGSNASWQEANETIQEALVDQVISDPGSVERANADRKLVQMNRRRDELINSDSGVQRDLRALEQIRQSADQPMVKLAKIDQLLSEASGDDELAQGLHQANAGLRTFAVRRERENFVQDIVMKTPEARQYELGRIQLEGARGNLLSRYQNGEMDYSEFERQGRGLREQDLRAQEMLAQQMAMNPEMRGRGFYEAPPRDEEEQEKWVMERLSALEGISPKFLAYSIPFGELLNGSSHLTPKLKDLVSAWRNTYEFAIIFETSGSAGDVLSQSANVDSDTFTQGIGQREKPEVLDSPYTTQAKMIQKGFSKFEEYGHEFADSNDAGREAIKKRIEQELGGKENYGNIYMKMAYRYWKFLGREAKFDYVRIEDKDGKFGKEGAFYPLSEIGDKIAGSRYAGKRYDGYSPTPIRFWLRRLYHNFVVEDENQKLYDDFNGAIRKKADNKFMLGDDGRPNIIGRADGAKVVVIKEKDKDGKLVKSSLKKSGMVRQEKRYVYWKPSSFDAVDYGIEDYVTEKMLSGADKAKAMTGVITEDMLKDIKWADKGTLYGVVADMWNKASKTREFEISTKGSLTSAGFDGSKLFASGEFYETFDDPRDTINPNRLRGELIANKNNAFLGIIPKFELKDVYDRDGNKSRFSRLQISTSEAQESSGLPTKVLSKSEIWGIIDNAMAAGFISREKGEELKRELLGFLGLPGIGVVRGAGVVFEVVTNPGNVFGFFWAMITKFLSLSLPKEFASSSR